MAPAPAQQGWRARLARWWVPGRFVVGIALGGLALWALNGQRGELVGATSLIGQVHTEWLLLGIASEFLSLVAFAGMQVWLLRVADVHIGLPRMTAITFGASAIASSIPAGPAVSSVFAFRQYRRGGADDGVALWTLLAALTCAALALTLIATAGVLIAEQEGASFDLIGVTIGVLIVTVLAAAVVWQKRVIVALARAVVRLSQSVTGRPRGDSTAIVSRITGRLKTVHLGFGELAGAMGWALANWVLDCGCLAFCFLAVGAGVPWRGLLLAYGAAQLAANLPITPGGLGVVEGSLTIALVAFGGVEVSTVAAVLLYRIISFWGFLPLGWLAWGGITWGNRRHDHAMSNSSPPGQEEPRPEVITP